jgi:hypothetical protein
MGRSVGALVLAACLGALAALGTQAAFAQGAPGPARCVQVQQVPGMLDERAVERFLNEQIAAGRARFTSITGVSTLVCAW